MAQRTCFDPEKLFRCINSVGRTHLVLHAADGLRHGRLCYVSGVHTIASHLFGDTLFVELAAEMRQPNHDKQHYPS
jgi:hypothetical protein